MGSTVQSRQQERSLRQLHRKRQNAQRVFDEVSVLVALATEVHAPKRVVRHRLALKPYRNAANLYPTEAFASNADATRVVTRLFWTVFLNRI